MKPQSRLTPDIIEYIISPKDHRGVTYTGVAGMHDSTYK